ncbi:cob(I)yrinic acid a,c-diamide adenosyltransferase [Pseudoteredinibacter isoporae]|uniref:cob(I)yrinic acid a,c-diamide adenosyltransferase n=1 Tax=Pseudoteredinibacter isoporae TaxID=570281 RepID=UPI003108AF5D
MTEEKRQRHKERMQQRKEIVDAGIARAQEDKGVFIVLSGDGKGKSSSGFGTALRALGHGYKVGVVQFIKGAWECGERNMLEHMPDVEFHVMGTGFTWETQDDEKDKQAAAQVWAKAKTMLQNPELHLVLFDEMTYALNYKWLDKQDVLDAIANRPEQQSVIITGRGAKKYLQDACDTYSEIKAVKHAFQAGIKAQKGIEW